METKQIEVKSIKTVYVAVDGTEFNDKEECVKYDKSALGVLKGRVKKLAVRVSNEEDLLHSGGEDNESWVIIPKSADEIALIRQLLLVMGLKMERTEELESQIGKVIWLTQNYDQDYMWFDTLEALTKRVSEVCER